MNAVHQVELKKAQFLTEYKRLCNQYDMMVAMDDDMAFITVRTDLEPDIIDICVLEMLVNKTPSAELIV